ncbi:MAG: HIT domain-containing protein [Bacteriovoracaceae bacterium]|nr:HIT domain-containing protein [Bacteriovoracaceae bacterium]
MSSEVFELILQGKIPAQKVFENEFVFAFKDIHPLANIHILFIHKQKTKDLQEMMTTHPEQIQQIMMAIAHYAREMGLDKSGYRIVSNVGAQAGQSVFYTHIHLLAGEVLGGFGRVKI